MDTQTAPALETPAPPVAAVEPAPSQDPAVAAGSAPAAETPAEGTIRDHRGRFEKRHRAESQKASPEDVPRIRELTKRLRTIEESYAQDRARWEAQAAPKAPDPAELVFKTPEKPAADGFTEREPQLDDFADKPDPYGAWLRATAAYDRKREAWEAKQATAETSSQEAQAKQAEAIRAIQQAHEQRVAEFMVKTPDYRAKIEALGDRKVSQVMAATIQMADNGPELLYALVSQPVLFDELYLITAGKPVDQESVETTRRWLASKVQAAAPRATGSAALPSYTPAPRPPSPVRASAVKTSEQPADSHSILEHVKHYRR